MCSTGNLIPRKHPARCRTGTRVPALSLPWSYAALSIAAACEVPQRSSVPCSSPSRSSVQRWNPPAPCGAPPPHIAQHHRPRCPDQCRATQTPPARSGTERHPPPLPCAAPTHAGGAPAALCCTRHPCSLPTTQDLHTVPAPLRHCLLPSPFVQRQNPKGQILGKQASTPLPMLPSCWGHPARGSAVWGIDLSLSLKDQVQNCLHIVVGNSSKLSAQVWPFALWPSSWHLHCRNWSSAKVKSGLADRSQHFLCLWKDPGEADTECSIALIPLLQYCHIFSLQGNVHDL